MRRGLERYAPRKGYDVGPIARTKIVDAVVQKAGLFPGDWVLDVETGNGLLGVNVARAFTRAKVVLADEDAELLAAALENARAEGCADRVRPVRCLPEALPFKDETFFYATVGLGLARLDEPLDALEEIHRTTGFMGKVYAPSMDLTRVKPKPRGMSAWVFDEETLEALRAMGFGKIQKQRIAVLPGGAQAYLVMMKRYDAEEGDDEDEDGDEDGE